MCLRLILVTSGAYQVFGARHMEHGPVTLYDKEVQHAATPEAFCLSVRADRACLHEILLPI